MGLTAKRMRRWNWIVVAAMLFASLAPALSHAVLRGAPADAQLTAICASTGLKYVKLDAVDAAERSVPERQAISVHADCPSCVFAHAPVLPADGTAFLPPAGPPLLPTGAASVPRAAGDIRLPAQPRAPPLSS
jgi:hypothetical protein